MKLQEEELRLQEEELRLQEEELRLLRKTNKRSASDAYISCPNLITLLEETLLEDSRRILQRGSASSSPLVAFIEDVRRHLGNLDSRVTEIPQESSIPGEASTS
jgi:hypothetical protein